MDDRIDGVTVKPCTCEADKLSPSERDEKQAIEESAQRVGNPVDDPIFLEERPEGLARQQESSYETTRVNGTSVTEDPLQAAAYNDKMTEMEDMSFSHKLFEQEINGYKGPVHYISHHAVLRPESTSTPVRNRV